MLTNSVHIAYLTERGQYCVDRCVISGECDCPNPIGQCAWSGAATGPRGDVRCYCSACDEERRSYGCRCKGPARDTCTCVEDALDGQERDGAA